MGNKGGVRVAGEKPEKCSKGHSEWTNDTPSGRYCRACVRERRHARQSASTSARFNDVGEWFAPTREQILRARGEL